MEYDLKLKSAAEKKDVLESLEWLRQHVDDLTKFTQLQEIGMKGFDHVEQYFMHNLNE